MMVRINEFSNFGKIFSLFWPDGFLIFSWKEMIKKFVPQNKAVKIFLMN